MLIPPSFATIAEERLHRKQRLAASYRLFARFGFDEGVAGHITARDPEHTDRFWVNPFGKYFGAVRASDLVLVDHSGEVVEGNGPVNRAAFAIHHERNVFEETLQVLEFLHRADEFFEVFQAACGVS